MYHNPPIPPHPFREIDKLCIHFIKRTCDFRHSAISSNGQLFKRWTPKLLTTELILLSGRTHSKTQSHNK